MRVLVDSLRYEPWRWLGIEEAVWRAQSPAHRRSLLEAGGMMQRPELGNGVVWGQSA